jgi:hypothetical protein
MHILMLSLLVALAACIVLLGAFAAFTKTPLGRRIEQEERQRRPRLN